jgi:NAD+ diphosphatase
MPGTFNELNHSFQCNKCGFYFFLNAAAAVMALIFNQDGLLLLTRRSVEPAKGMLDMPGGFIDPGESAEQAILREMKEELNVVPSSVCYYTSLPNQYHFSGTIVHTTDLVFRCQVDDLDKIKCSDDVESIEWHNPIDVEPSMVAFNSVKTLLKKITHEG